MPPAVVHVFVIGQVCTTMQLIDVPWTLAMDFGTKQKLLLGTQDGKLIVLVQAGFIHIKS